jgi:hypothetical protein
MNLFLSLRDRMGKAVGAVVAGVLMLACGSLLAFVFSPMQALEARRIDRLPLMDAGSVEAAAAGEELLVTGQLLDNPLQEEGGYVAYRLEEWVVTLLDPEDESDEPDGDWKKVEQVVPALNLEVGGRTVRIAANHDARLSGSLAEELILSESYDEAKYMGELLPHGSLRLTGLLNDDLVTAWGKKGSTGDLIPDELYGGDRFEFVESKKDAAKGLFIGGVALMVCAPVMVIGGILGAFFGRRRRFGR